MFALVGGYFYANLLSRVCAYIVMYVRQPGANKKPHNHRKRKKMIDYNIKANNLGVVRHVWEKDGFELAMIVRPDAGTMFQVSGRVDGIELDMDGLAEEPKIEISLASVGAMDTEAAVDFAAKVQQAAETANQFQLIINSFM